ncbi:DUF1987 domain-containing protein [Desulfobacterales bacterium HSG2]|nr:DUF1987 domain-containing protein [Desulfobacterales bacterium HSG2]
MDNLLIKPTKYTPLIKFDSDRHVLEIKGESYPDNIFEFYEPVLDWVKAYLKELSENQMVTVVIELIYYNSNSAKILTNFFDMLQNAVIQEKNIVIHWYYDKENDMALEYGEEFKDDLESLPFHLIQIQEGN